MTAAAPTRTTPAGRAAAAGARRHRHPRLWAGTKLLVLAGIGVLLTFYPGWVPIALVAAAGAGGRGLARIPRGALPSCRAGCGVLLALGGVTAAFAGGTPCRSRRGSSSNWAGC